MDKLRGNSSAVAFLRVSSNRQRDNTSHETQETEIVEYCRENSFDLLKIVRMVESAKDSKKRIHYQQGLQWALKHKARHILFYVFDRETRNLTDNEKNEGLVRAGKIVLHYVKERKVFHKDSSDSDFFLRDVQAVTNKQFIRQLSTKVVDAMRTKAEGGHFPGNHPPLGYVHVRMKDESGRDLKRGTTIGIDPDERVVEQVRREFALRAAGMSAEQIRNQIIHEGLIPAAKIPKYHRSAIERRLRNPFYYGEFEWNGQLYPGKHPLFISKKHIAEVASSFGGSNPYQRKPAKEVGVFGGGWMTCADEQCGCHVVFDPKTKQLKGSGRILRFDYYHCTNGRRIHPSMRGMSVKEPDLWKQFESAVESITITDEFSKLVADALNETHSKVSRARKKEIADYRAGLEAVEREEDKAYVDLRRGLLTEEMYHRQIARLRLQRNEFTKLLEGANSALDGAYLHTAQSILELAKNAKSLWLSRSPQERLDFLKLILSNPRLEGTNVRYDLKKPFATLALMKSEVEWRPHLDAFRTELSRFAA
jgi:site-specific DNA recombinase